MARSFFVLYPGLYTPQNFKAGAAPSLLTHQDLWADARLAPPSLLFRVRTETGEPGGQLAPGDKFESCVGLVDAAVRWRSVFAMGRNIINSVKTPQLSAACWKAAQFISTQHPANVTPQQREGIYTELMTLVKQLMEQGEVPRQQLSYEAAVASHVAQIVQADNDVEAAHAVPFERALCPFNEEKQTQLFQSRMTTLDTVSGSILLHEAQNRLSERIPQWLYSPMPELATPAEQRVAGREGDDV